MPIIISETDFAEVTRYRKKYDEKTGIHHIRRVHAPGCLN